ncbi:MAG TPA: two-component sensor histidine kinase [Candidatus Lachnoclostridium pullistercoris]|uniref:histidine kinase n=1 Tax=Candidatus Lachnoclostridium pullistercoris TaxID=2838632 RepID=A0A9D2PCI6_9FIRM|nr:two-component sensor histidine kinase [Candidatus Lachnoclostridium pullistercoris]
MTKRIFRSILCVSAAVLLAGLIITLGVLYGYINVQQRNELEDEITYLAPGVEAQGVEYLKKLENTDKRITLVDRDGTVLYDNETDAGEMENHSGREEIEEALQTGEGTASRRSSTLAEPTIYYAKRLDNGQVLRLAGSEYRMMTVFANLLYPICAVCLLMILLAAFFAMRSSEKIVEPINRLDVEDVKEGDVYEEIAPLIQKIGHQKETITNQVLEAQRQQREFEDMKEQMRREFTANVSHELKTPLTSISGFAEIIKDGFVKPEDIPGFAGKIFEESQRLIVLVNDIIKISQLDEGGIPYDREEIDLYDMAEEVLGRLAEPAKKKNINLQILGEHAKIRGVRLILDEVIYNLCDNAVKYNRENGTVIVRVKRDRRGIQLVVADTGIGIPKEHQDRVFERFYRVDKSHSKAIGGTGLGLSIVKHGAAFLGAAVELDSRPDEGTVITLTWKAA